MLTRYTRLFADAQGRSCLEDVEVALSPGLATPPAEPLHTAPFLASEGTFWIGAPAAWKGEEPHPAPRRMVSVTVRGEYEVTVSGGALRRFPAGSVLLIEDTWGEGHKTRITSAEGAVTFTVGLPATER
jgi:hypothetical protein